MCRVTHGELIEATLAWLHNQPNIDLWTGLDPVKSIRVV